MARTGLSRHFMLKENISWEGSFTASQKTLVDKPNTHSHCIQVYKKVAKNRFLDETTLYYSVYKHKLDSGSIKTSPRDGLRAIGKETTSNCATLGHSDLL